MKDFLLGFLKDGQQLPALAAVSASIVLLFLHWIMFRTGSRQRGLAKLIEAQVEPWLKNARIKHQDDFKPKDRGKKPDPKSF